MTGNIKTADRWQTCSRRSLRTGARAAINRVTNKLTIGLRWRALSTTRCWTIILIVSIIDAVNTGIQSHEHTADMCMPYPYEISRGGMNEQNTKKNSLTHTHRNKFSCVFKSHVGNCLSAPVPTNLCIWNGINFGSAYAAVVVVCVCVFALCAGAGDEKFTANLGFARIVRMFGRR